ncbi:hypothetical protein MPLSOD_260013 [Mesorhizobium sp. SOD10]|nr:hypothetical protein MPLSOD_260013 [Mesorhizobium sp. SOD10]
MCGSGPAGGARDGGQELLYTGRVVGGGDACRTGGWVATVDEEAVVGGCIRKTSGGGIGGVTIKRLLLFSDVLRTAAHLLCQRETVLIQPMLVLW